MGYQGEFIEAIAPGAKNQMKLTGILASLTMAQAILESNWGRSALSTEAFNLFGIKGSGSVGSRSYPTQEWDGSKMITITVDFRAYNNWEESIADHNALFTRLARYSNLIGEHDYRRACVLVQKDGYATDPDYSTKLITIIEAYGLSAYDQEAIVEQGLPTWAVQPRQELTDLGITDGDRPNDFTLRIEAWTFIHRGLIIGDTRRVDFENRIVEGLPGMVEAAISSRPIPEISTEAPEWALDDLAYMEVLGIMDGSRPNHYATRAEVAVMISRAIDPIRARITEIENQLESKGLIERLTDLIMKPFRRDIQ